jgi:carboxyl-terminal processing protease
MLMPPREIYTRPMAILVDEGSFSATDNFVAAIRDNRPDTVVVGRTTAGGTGAPRVFRLSRTGSAVSFCTMRVYRPSGALIEGRGTLPDIPILWRRSDIEMDQDPDLDAATQWLSRH